MSIAEYTALPRVSRARNAVAPLIAGFLLAGLVAGCRKSAPQAPPPTEVRVFTVQARPLANIIEVPGRLQAIRTSEVRARVDGIVERRLYAEGTDVRAGQPLFQIDPRQLRAQANAAEAALARAEATAANAEKDVARYKGLVAQKALSQQEYDAAEARLRTAQADVALSRAQLDAARLNLGYTTVTAPIGGRAGRAEVTEGALVSGSAGTLLTTIEQTDPIYVNLSQSSSELLSLRQQITSGALKLPAMNRVAVRVVLEDGTEYPMSGRLDFLDQRIDEATGTAALRAEVPNPQHRLLPGQFVRARLEAGVRSEGILIPQRAVTVAPQGATVLVVGQKDIVESRPVTLGNLQGASWMILGGLTAGDRIIVDGVQKAMPGQPVRVLTTPTPVDSAPPADVANDASRPGH